MVSLAPVGNGGSRVAVKVSCVFTVQGSERGAAAQRGAASLHGAGGHLLEHSHVPLAEDM